MAEPQEERSARGSAEHGEISKDYLLQPGGVR